MALVKFMYGNEAQYTSLATKDEDALYFLLDSGKIYKGSTYLASKEGVNITETQDAAGDTVYTLTVGSDTYSFYSTTAVAAKIAAAITDHNVAATGSTSGHVTLSDAINDTTSTSADGVAATPAAVAAAVAEAESYTDSQIASVAGGMRFKGAVASAAEIQALTDVENGDTYRASAAFQFNGENVELGDLLIASVTENSSVAYTFTSYGDSEGTNEYATGTVNSTNDTTTIDGNEYTKVVVATNSVPEFVGQEFYIISSATAGNTLYQLYDTNSQPVDIWVRITGTESGNSVTTWYVFQANIDGAVTTASTLSADGLVLGNGGNSVKILAAGNENTILQMTANGPAWVTPEAAGITDNTTYTFTSGTTGDFTVLASTQGATPQTVSIGKPDYAGTADKVANALTIGNQTYDGSVAVTVGTTNAITSGSTDLVESGAVYDALVWQSLS